MRRPACRGGRPPDFLRPGLVRMHAGMCPRRHPRFVCGARRGQARRARTRTALRLVRSGAGGGGVPHPAGVGPSRCQGLGPQPPADVGDKDPVGRLALPRMLPRPHTPLRRGLGLPGHQAHRGPVLVAVCGAWTCPRVCFPSLSGSASQGPCAPRHRVTASPRCARSLLF